jgi:hypothetical protein
LDQIRKKIRPKHNPTLKEHLKGRFWERPKQNGPQTDLVGDWLQSAYREEMVHHFHQLGWTVHGMDNNMQADFFGPQGDMLWNQQRMVGEFNCFTHHTVNLRDREAVAALVASVAPDAVIIQQRSPSTTWLHSDHLTTLKSMLLAC